MYFFLQVDGPIIGVYWRMGFKAAASGSLRYGNREMKVLMVCGPPCAKGLRVLSHLVPRHWCPSTVLAGH